MRLPLALHIMIAALLLTHPSPGAAGEGDAVVGHLAFRDQVVSISARPHGSAYTVRDRDGRVLAANLSSVELLASYPELHRRLRDSTAGSILWGGSPEEPAAAPPFAGAH